MDRIKIATILGCICLMSFGIGMGSWLGIESDKDFLIIYVAGPYWDDTEEGRLANTYRAIDAGIYIYYKCQYAIIPHLGHWVDPRMTELGYPERPNSFWYVLDNMILEKADMFIKLDSSRGADAEEQLAKDLGIQIIDSLQEVPDNCPDGGFEEYYDGSNIGK